MRRSALLGRGHWRLGAFVAATIGVTAGGIAYASIPDGSGVIHACYKKSGGTLRVIDDSQQFCDSNETPIQWSQTGPQGIPGPQGPTGPTGPTGPAGHVDVGVFVDNFHIQPGQTRASVSCADGWEATGGGYHITAFRSTISNRGSPAPASTNRQMTRSTTRQRGSSTSTTEAVSPRSTVDFGSCASRSPTTEPGT
jgi:hypothetical protein